MNTYKIFYLLFLLVFVTACHDDIEDDRQVTSGPEFIPTIISEVQSDVIGYVYDENENPVSDVLISMHVGSDITTTSTNSAGIFRFSTQALDGNGTYIKAQKDGYILGSDRINPVSNEGTLYSYINLFSLNTNTSFVGEENAIIDIDGGGSIEFEANSIVNERGEVHKDRVIYTAKRIATDDPKLADRMPGGLYGLANNGANVTLATLGMVAVELRDANGGELNLAEGKTAVVTFPIAEKDRANAPDEVKLWSFDEVNGLWIEEGTSTKIGDLYEASVSHFSFWNCDAPFPLVQVCGSVEYDNGEPAPGVQVLVFADGLGAGAGYTDSEGRFCGKMPKGVELTFQVTTWACQNVLTSVTAGPFENSATVDPIVIPSVDPFTFSGTVLCETLGEENALVVIQSGSFNFFTTSDADGNFSLTVNDQVCDSEAEFTIFAISDNTMESSDIIALVDGSQSDLVLQVCADCTFDAELINNANPCNKEEGTLAVNVLSGLNNYTFSWDNGNTTSSITYEVPGIYRVTVTDETGDCDKILAATIEPDSFRFELFANVSLQDCSGSLSSIELIPVNGTPPFTYSWGGDITINNTDNPELNGLAPGMYEVTATDANGCEIIQAYTTIQSGGLIVEFFSDVLCNPELGVFVNGGVAPYTYEWTLDGVNISNEQFVFRDNPGEYCVKVTDANGCTGELCDFFNGFDPVFWDNFNTCVDSGMIYTLFPDFEYIFQYSNGQTQSVNGGGDFFYDPIQNGYNYLVTVIGLNSGCQETFSSNLVTYDSLTIVSAANSTIEVDISGGGCGNGCVPIGPFIYAEGNLSVDLSTDNGNLAPGNYIVALREEQSNCLIAHQKVTLP